MFAFEGYEGPLSWVAVHLLLVAGPAAGLFVIGRGGRLRLREVAAVVAVAAVLLLPAVACVHLNRDPAAWIDAARAHATSPGVTLFGVTAPGWATMLGATAIGLASGAALFRSGRRRRVA